MRIGCAAPSLRGAARRRLSFFGPRENFCDHAGCLYEEKSRRSSISLSIISPWYTRMPNLLQGKQGNIAISAIGAPYNHHVNQNLAGPLIERAGANVGTRRPAPRVRPTGHPPAHRAVLRIRDTTGVTYSFLSFLGTVSYRIRILMYLDVSCMYLDCILMCPVHIHQDTSRYIKIHLYL
jgi:hypothetical protein